MDAALAYDLGRERIVLFGGHDGGTAQNDTWVWDGTDWEHLSIYGSGWPAARSDHAMAYGNSCNSVIMFGGGPGPWSKTDPWNGWWGRNPPFHHAVFVLTHHPREPLPMQGGTTFTFVTDGIESALEQARHAADGKDVALSGGARAAQQYLRAGLVDEMQLHVVPTLLGGGERLFDNVNDLNGLVLVETVAAPNVTHLRFAKR